MTHILCRKLHHW